MQTKSKDEMVRETIAVRGVAAAIQAMHTPTFENLDYLLRKEGYRIVPLDEQTNKQNENQRNG